MINLLFQERNDTHRARFHFHIPISSMYIIFSLCFTTISIYFYPLMDRVRKSANFTGATSKDKGDCLTLNEMKMGLNVPVWRVLRRHQKRPFLQINVFDDGLCKVWRAEFHSQKVMFRLWYLTHRNKKYNILTGSDLFHIFYDPKMFNSRHGYKFLQTEWYKPQRRKTGRMKTFSVSYHESVSLSAFKAMSWPGGAPSPFFQWFQHWLILCTLGLCIVNVHRCRNSEGF